MIAAGRRPVFFLNHEASAGDDSLREARRRDVRKEKGRTDDLLIAGPSPLSRSEKRSCSREPAPGLILTYV
jgi:hypothetical protein